MTLPLALLPSPFLGPAVWRPVADVLRANGFDVLEVRAPATAPRSPADVLATYLGAIPTDVAVVVVPHSNAGLFVPAIVSSRRVGAMVFVDAGVPPRRGQFPLAPSDFRAFLAGLVDDAGQLPPWTRWWDADVSELFPSAAVRDRVEAEQHRLPLSYFSGAMSAPPGWDEGVAAAYLAFGDTYAEDRNEAVRRGWTVTTLSGKHLHMLVDPHPVAAAVGSMLGEMGIRPGRDVRM
ncbi:MAG: hypothetical protein WKF54_05610 [Nocardioidaceae bacterium]